MKKDQIIKNINPLFLKGVAHRGYHNETITENSLGAFKNAITNNFAFELDVHLTKDEKIIVSHDSSLKRTTGKEGIIEELTLKEIKDNYRLLNDEEVPTLEEVFELTKESVPIVVELKPYTKTKNYKVLALKVMKALKVIKDKKNIILISFYPQCLLHFKNSGFVRCLLVDRKNSRVYALRHFFEGVDLEWQLLEEEKYQKAKETKLVMCWTIESKEEYNKIKEFSDSVTFQHFDITK